MLRALFLSLCTLFAAGAAPGGPVPSIQLRNPMAFGTILSANQGGMLNLTDQGALFPVGAGLRPGAPEAPAQARLQLQGKPGAAYTLALQPPQPVLTGPRGGRIVLQSFNVIPASLQGVLDPNGTAEVEIGARLDLPRNLPPGLYLANVRLQMLTMGPRGPVIASRDFPVQVRLQASLKLVALQNLDFGTVLPGREPGLLEVKATGGYLPARPGGPILVKGSPRPAVFVLEGPAGTDYVIQLPATVLLAGPGAAIPVQDFTLDTPARGSLPPEGKRFALGARILIAPDQSPGAYRGLVPVTVAYP